ncbi:hypothetical protein EAF04_009785 [Stromatinia cepivora]|nr:hypothetical protein EAF04_009785 [Stromatinia cepivora]
MPKKDHQKQPLTSQAFKEPHGISQMSKFRRSLNIEKRILSLDLHAKVCSAKKDIARQALDRLNIRFPYFWESIDIKELVTDRLAELAERAFVHMPSMEEVKRKDHQQTRSWLKKEEEHLRRTRSIAYIDSGQARYVSEISRLLRAAIGLSESAGRAP